MFLCFQNAQDVSEFNVISMLHELMHGTKYELPKPETDEKKEEDPPHATLTGWQRKVIPFRWHRITIELRDMQIFNSI